MQAIRYINSRCCCGQCTNGAYAS